MLIKIINCHKDSEKPRKFSRSRITKRTVPEKFRRILRQAGNFSNFLGNKLSVTPGTRFYENLESQEMVWAKFI